MSSIEELKGRIISKNGIAMANQYMVTLPPMKGAGSRALNVLCKSVDMPGKQITTLDRAIGIHNEKIVSGYLVDDISMTFHVLNDYGVKKYFDTWRQLMVGDQFTAKKTKEVPAEESEKVEGPDGEKKETKTVPDGLDVGEVGYKLGENGYAKSIKIHQLMKPQARFGFDIGPFDLNFDLGGSSIYTVELLDAFPTTFQAIQLTNEADGLVEFTVQFSYTDWKVVEDKRSLLSGLLGLNLGGLI